MPKCVKCGKKGLFLKLKDNLCSDCYAENLKHNSPEYIDSKKFYDDIVRACANIPEDTISLGQCSTADEIRVCKEACDYVHENLPRWKNYKYFPELFFADLVKDKKYNWYNHPVIDVGIISSSDTLDSFDFDTAISKYCHKVWEKEIDCLLAKRIKHFHVVGTTFKNGRRSRQTILRKIRFHDPPFSRSPEITIEKYEWEGSPAFGVYAKGEQIGNISQDDIPFFLEHWNEYCCVSDYEILGGGHLPSGESLNYGIIIVVEFRII